MCPEAEDKASNRPKLTQLAGAGREESYVCFGSEADSCSAATHVRFTPNSDRESRHPQTAMSALPPIADMCGANSNVCFGPRAPSGATEARRLTQWPDSYMITWLRIVGGGSCLTRNWIAFWKCRSPVRIVRNTQCSRWLWL